MAGTLRDKVNADTRAKINAARAAQKKGNTARAKRKTDEARKQNRRSFEMRIDHPRRR